MDNQKVYKVLFKGVILEGFDKIQVIENVHNITRIPKDIITRKFFSGKTVVIRHADSLEYAQDLQEKFAAAGIETYIETDIKDQPSLDVSTDDLNTSQSKANKSIKLAAGIVVLLLAVSAAYFFLNEPAVVEVVEKTTIKEAVKKPVIKPVIKPLIKQESFLNTGQIEVLIKITDISELKYISQLLPLLNIDSFYFELIKQQAADKTISVSNEKPLYLYQSKQHKGIVFNSANDFENLKKRIQEQQSLTKPLTSDLLCSDNNQLNLYQTKNSFVLSSLNDPSKLKGIDNFFADKELFHPGQSKKPAAFNLYYAHSISEPLTLSAQGDSLWLSLGNTFTNKYQEFLSATGIENNQTVKLSSLKTAGFSELLLQIISLLNYDNSGIKDSITASDFEPEQITLLNPDFSAKDIKPYQTNLDIELQPQWQDGPFAITTNNYQFDQQLIIELLAKGQNIKNLLEYAHSAKLSTSAIYNNNKENIFFKDCSNKFYSDSYFKDIDGVQEAYVNDDFINYYAVTAKEQVRIKPGYELSDIVQIKGDISLRLPETISQQALLEPFTKSFSQFEGISLLIDQHEDKKTISYQLIDPNKYFISLRAFNTSGDILETTAFKQKNVLKNQLIHYQQSFSEPVAKIKVFYSKKIKSLVYPFTLKPEILASSSPLLTEDTPPAIFDNKELDIKPVSKKALADNPQWLGEKAAEKNITPFHVSLFLHNRELSNGELSNGELNKKEAQNTSIDAVLNIKTSVTPLISQNLSAVKVTLSDDKETFIDNFIAFSEKTLISEELSSDNIESYLNNNSAFQLQQSNNKEIKGSISLSLPTSFKTHSSEYQYPGQIIKLDNILVKQIKLTRQQVQFEIAGKIDGLMQLKLYNANNELISEPLEFKHIEENKALLTLLYNDKIHSIKLVLAQTTVEKTYPFSLLM